MVERDGPNTGSKDEGFEPSTCLKRPEWHTKLVQGEEDVPLSGARKKELPLKVAPCITEVHLETAPIEKKARVKMAA